MKHAVGQDSETESTEHCPIQSLYFAIKHVQVSNNSKSVWLDNQAVHLRLPITRPTHTRKIKPTL